MLGLEAKFGLQRVESSFGHWFSKKISYLVINGDIVGDKMPKCNTFTHKMKIQFNVFATSLKHKIDDHMKSTEIVTVEFWR